MKKFLLLLVVIATFFINISASAQAPEDLSFLTNRASFASWALRQVDEIEVSVMSSASGSPESGIPSVTKRFTYSGPPSLSSMAKSLKGQVFTLKTPIPDSIAIVSIQLKNTLPGGHTQYLFGGGVAGRPEFDGKNWQLPKEASEPSMYLSGSIFIPAPGVTKAWVVETNQWGWAVKKSLSVWYGEGFYFEGTLAGEAFLCLQFGEKGGEDSQWVYDLHLGGIRAPLPSIIAKISIRDSQDIRDYGDNATGLSHWVYTYKPDYSSLTYGVVPLLVANYTKDTATMIWVGSSVGYARKFNVTRISDTPGVPDTKFVLEVPDGLNYYGHTFKPGLYHIVPLGIDVCPDWWKISEVNGWGGGGKG